MKDITDFSSLPPWDTILFSTDLAPLPPAVRLPVGGALSVLLLAAPFCQAGPP